MPITAATWTAASPPSQTELAANAPAGYSRHPAAGGDGPDPHGGRRLRSALRHVLPARGSSGCADKEELEAADLVALLQAGIEGVRQRGKAEAGRQDHARCACCRPWQAMQREGTLAEVLRAGAAAAEAGMLATIPLQARKGRASYLGRAQHRPSGPRRDVGVPAAQDRGGDLARMIGFVIVSHSAKIAEGVCELAAQVAQGKVAPGGGRRHERSGKSHRHRRLQSAGGDRVGVQRRGRARADGSGQRRVERRDRSGTSACGPSARTCA